MRRNPLWRREMAFNAALVTMVSVRRFLFILLILLLPLRGWTTDQMALAMGAGSAHPGTSVSAMQPDCHSQMHVGPHADGHATASSDPTGFPASKACKTCQLCMGAAPLAALGGAPLAPGQAAAPDHFNAIYASADLARITKPPVR